MVMVMGILFCAWQLTLSVPLVTLAWECCAAAWPRRRPQPEAAPQPRPAVWVLIPAHNEQAEICATLRSVARQLQGRDAVCVVADNCDDRTAVLARGLGAVVMERADDQRRGKGYALQAGLDFIRDTPRDVVVIIDADCRIEPGALDALARAAVADQVPVQARYLMTRPTSATPSDVISQFAVIVKNLVRPVGLQRLGGPALLTGSGMAFPWDLIMRQDLASGHIVEDMQLGYDFLLAGYPPKLLESAGIVGSLATSGRNALTQRTRWEHGHMHVIATQLPRLLAAVARRPRWSLLLAALDLTVPPLAFLALLCGGTWLLGAVWWWCREAVTPLVGGPLSFVPLLVATAHAVLLSGAIGVSWWVYARRDVPWRTLMLVPWYVLRKLPIYVKFLCFRRERQWIRATRHASNISGTDV